MLACFSDDLVKVDAVSAMALKHLLSCPDDRAASFAAAQTIVRKSELDTLYLAAKYVTAMRHLYSLHEVLELVGDTKKQERFCEGLIENSVLVNYDMNKYPDPTACPLSFTSKNFARCFYETIIRKHTTFDPVTSEGLYLHLHKLVEKKEATYQRYGVMNINEKSWYIAYRHTSRLVREHYNLGDEIPEEYVAAMVQSIVNR